MKFCNPHPGRMGAIIPLPESIRLIANQLVDKEAVLGEFELEPSGAVYLLKTEANKCCLKKRK